MKQTVFPPRKHHLDAGINEHPDGLDGFCVYASTPVG